MHAPAASPASAPSSLPSPQIISSMFATIDPVPQEGRNAVALLVLTAIFLSMNSAPQLAFAQLAKPVFLKQRDNHLFPPWTFAVTQARL